MGANQPATTELVPVQAHAPAVLDRGLSLATSEVIARAKQIREVMESVMKKDVHYGVIPGTQKPTMYQPGADVLAVTFRIAPKIGKLEDLSLDDDVRYRVTVQGLHQVTGELLAEGIGECSSNEEKYRWRRPVCDEEFKETPEDRRREKWGKGKGGGTFKNKQIRTSPADVANTILKMAVKRGKIAMILNATAASDVFAQDLEDLSDELRDSLAEEHGTEAPATVPMPQRKAEDRTPAAPAPTTAPQPLRVTKVEKCEASKTRGKADAELPAGVTRVFYFLITDSTGRVCSTWSEDMYLHCGKFADDKTVVEMTTEAGTPWPRLTEIAPAPQEPQP